MVIGNAYGRGEPCLLTLSSFALFCELRSIEDDMCATWRVCTVDFILKWHIKNILETFVGQIVYQMVKEVTVNSKRNRKSEAPTSLYFKIMKF